MRLGSAPVMEYEVERGCERFFFRGELVCWCWMRRWRKVGPGCPRVVHLPSSRRAILRAWPRASFRSRTARLR